MNQSEIRIGRFTSSGISALLSVGKDKVSFGKPAITYIAEKNMERKLGRSLNTETSSRPTSWGKVCELRVFELLGLEYQLVSTDSISHPQYGDIWAGSPDLIKEDSISEIKCPFTLKSFCQFADCKTITEIRENHPDGEDYYWQIVSNAILADKPKAELIIYVPYKKEIQDIRDWVNNYDGDQSEMEWIQYASIDDLPYLNDGGHYKNLNIFEFEIPQADKDLLTEKVLAAGKLLK